MFGTGGVPGAASRLFSQRPDRVAAAWRRERQASAVGDPVNLLDGLVEDLVREIGHALAGAEGSPWSRTRGVLRLSPELGARRLYEEFSALRRCLNDALDVIRARPSERARVHAALDEAVDSALALCHRLKDPSARPPLVPFGGVVVELYQGPALAEARDTLLSGSHR